MASRRKSRILAFQAIFFWEASLSENKISSAHTHKTTAVNLEDILSFSWVDENKLASYRENGTETYAKLLTAGTLENINEIDKKIIEHLDNWDFDRLNRVDLAVLRLSVYSLMYQKEIHPSITIDEAIGICREYGTDESFKFVNGVLDSIRRALLPEDSQKTANIHRPKFKKKSIP